MHYTHDPEIRAQNRGPVMIAVVVVLLCLSTTMVGLRILCRSMIKGFGLDDLAAVLTLVSSLIHSLQLFLHPNTFRFVSLDLEVP